jgi:hypothetical protein
MISQVLCKNGLHKFVAQFDLTEVGWIDWVSCEECVAFGTEAGFCKIPSEDLTAPF